MQYSVILSSYWNVDFDDLETAIAYFMDHAESEWIINNETLEVIDA